MSFICILSSCCLFAQELYTTFPRGFRGTTANELTDAHYLSSFFQSIHEGKAVKVMQIGDSHTRGNIYPNTVGEVLSSEFKSLTFCHYGINGAWARRFYEDDMIRKVATERPNVVIISFGTNEAHGDFSPVRHDETLQLLTERIRQYNPGVLFILTTPQGSYITRGKGKNRRRQINQNTQNVAVNIKNYAHSHGIALWDIYNIAGGPSFACTNWSSTGLMQADGVHFTVQGYELQGRLLGEAILKAYRATHFKGSQTRMFQPSTPLEQKPNKSLKCLNSTRHDS